MTWRGYKERTCERCGKCYRPTNGRNPRFCSLACKGLSERRADVDEAELRRLVDQMPITHIAEKFGVSDKAVKKWCKKFGIPTKPRGYWQKLQAGKKPEADRVVKLPKIERKGTLGVREPSAFEKYRKLWGM